MKRFGLSADERIKSRKDFEDLYSRGSTIFSSTRRIKAVYIIDQNSDDSGVRISFAISHKSGKAVWRNRLRRLLKESYRLNKNILVTKATNSNLFIRLIFSPYSISMRKNKNIYLGEIMPDVIEIMSRISSDL